MYISAQPKAAEVLGFTCTCFLVTELHPEDPSLAFLQTGACPP